VFFPDYECENECFVGETGCAEGEQCVDGMCSW
jgi:hypothetical protein